ncbi:MAG: response regulator [Candidatus Cloacimonetes bacterium]|nr:response regulator [Candidatus Cloacimonadota bacterium]MCF7814287.1 response regulator [Candidatus Cloacimonadota bacterium]MCF7868884.1 response regulator [Candidatus Cloacimonadota bacterium]MCF7884328.1 response regulator [Candidatus Cloacimonadota bacterium]
MAAKSVEILLVEDNIHDERLTIKALQKNNLTNKLHVVRDGEEALEFLFHTGRYKKDETSQEIDPPRLILLDLKLPKIDGLELLNIIKKDERTKTIPVVILTSSTQESDMLQSYRLGVNSYIVKPVEFDKFISAVSDLGLYWMILNELPK